jgi:menaquinone-dependent protoporphyrinogen oxidase
METRALVAYASKYGSTQQVAEAVAATLRESGLAVDVQHMRKVRSLEEYAVIVLGAPFYLGAWHKDAQEFLSRHSDAIVERSPAGIRVAVFALGPLSADEQGWRAARAALDTELAKHPWLRPVATELFGGKFDPGKLRFPDTMIVALPASPLHGIPAGDMRDWTAIRAWAAHLAAELQPA